MMLQQNRTNRNRIFQYLFLIFSMIWTVLKYKGFLRSRFLCHWLMFLIQRLRVKKSKTPCRIMKRVIIRLILQWSASITMMKNTMKCHNYPKKEKTYWSDFAPFQNFSSSINIKAVSKAEFLACFKSLNEVISSHSMSHSNIELLLRY